MEYIRKKLLKILKSDELDAAVTVGTAAVSIKYPLAGLFLTAAQQIGNLADEMRINAVVKGLSTELNQEIQINSLYSYVEKSEENAFYVVNTLRKSLLVDSLIACTVMGRILAKHAKDGSKYDQDDNIIFHALENATDDDIRQFYRVMQDYKTKNEDGNDVFHIPNDVIKDSIFSSSLDWCVYNRIFNGTSGILWGVPEQDYDDSHSPASAAYKLKEYVDAVKQVLEYGE